MKAILVFLGFAVISLLVATSFNFSFQDELRTQSTYCVMVKEGTWPDYKGIYQTACVEGVIMSTKEDAIVALEQLIRDIKTGRVVPKDFCHEIDISCIDWPRMGMTSITYYVKEGNGHASDDQP